ncbi:MAG: STAS domain-containing protein [bacterium]|nr:STAS domain-containing protein [bacterium]
MLNIDLEYKKGILFLRLNGILSKKTSFILEDSIKNMVEKVGIKYVLINFEKLDNIDTNGIASIIESYNKYIKDNGKLMICGYEDNVKIKIENSELLKYAYNTTNELKACNLINI